MKQMKWIEQIRVRSTESTLQEAMPSLLTLVKQIEEGAGDAETFMVQHALYQGDLAVVLVWVNEVKPEKTREGMMIAERLQRFGPIDHGVWIPAENTAGTKS